MPTKRNLQDEPYRRFPRQHEYEFRLPKYFKIKWQKVIAALEYGFDTEAKSKCKLCTQCFIALKEEIRRQILEWEDAREFEQISSRSVMSSIMNKFDKGGTNGSSSG